MRRNITLLGIVTVAVVLWVNRSADSQINTHENIILGRPTATSIVISVQTEKNTLVAAQYGTTSDHYPNRTPPAEPSEDNIAEVSIGGLLSDTRYYYRICYFRGSDTDCQPGEQHSFHTQRSRGSTFRFGVQGDSHPESGTSRGGGMSGPMFHPDLYQRTLENVAHNQPDLYFMLGDDFSISNEMEDFFLGENIEVNLRLIDDLYSNQRNFLTTMANSTSLFAVNGNHEETRRAFLGTPLHDMAIHAGSARTRFFPLPAPNHFYSADPELVPGVGFLRDYYAFTWGDALFVAIDPYWHSPAQGWNSGGMGAGMGAGNWSTKIISEEKQTEYLNLISARKDRWEATMGDAQYEWLGKTLSESNAKYKFVFAHHVCTCGRGGIENAKYWEWGGHNMEGTWDFDERRPGWELPIHQLMVKHGVTIFFQGHDHLFARQDLDGIIYQSVPVPGDPQYTGRNKHAYLSGTVLDNTGYLNVEVSREHVRVDYVRSFLPGDEVGGRENGEIEFSYITE